MTDLKKDCERKAREILNRNCVAGTSDRYPDLVGDLAEALLSEHLIVQKRVEIEQDVAIALGEEATELHKQIDELKKQVKIEQDVAMALGKEATELHQKIDELTKEAERLRHIIWLHHELGHIESIKKNWVCDICTEQNP